MSCVCECALYLVIWKEALDYFNCDTIQDCDNDVDSGIDSIQLLTCLMKRTC